MEAEREPNYLDHIMDAIATDAIGLRIVAVMLALLTVRVFGNLRELTKEEPSAPRG